MKWEEKPLGGRPPILSIAEICTIILIQKEYNICNIKSLYKLINTRFNQDFRLGTYKSFNETIIKYSRFLLQIVFIILQINKAKSGILTFVDSTSIPVCKIWRSSSHKVMKVLAHKSKTTIGWYYGIKLHIICDENGNLIDLAFTTSTVDDRIPLAGFLKRIFGKIIGADGGYCGQNVINKAKETGNIVLATVRKNMKTISTKWQNEVLKLRSVVERCFSAMKTRLNLVTSLPRSINGYLAHYSRCLFMFVFKEWLVIRPVAINQKIIFI
jgi:hypothetical protein